MDFELLRPPTAGVGSPATDNKLRRRNMRKARIIGTTLAIARAAGETAPLLFTTAIAGQIVDWNPTHSVQSIPLTIFQNSESADPNLHAQAWAAAFVLIAFVLVSSLTARFLLDRSRRKLGLQR